MSPTMPSLHPGLMTCMAVGDDVGMGMGNSKLSRRVFARLARNDPAELERVLRSPEVDPCLLTYAAEAVALVRDPSETLLAVLAALLRHPRPYVREGACYGARAHLGQLREALEAVALDDAMVGPLAREVLGES